MDFMSFFAGGLPVGFGIGYVWGLEQGGRKGKECIRNRILSLKKIKQREKEDAEIELETAPEDEYQPESNCRPYFESKRGRVDREQLQREKIQHQKRLPGVINNLENEIAWLDALLKDIRY